MRCCGAARRSKLEALAELSRRREIIQAAPPPPPHPRPPHCPAVFVDPSKWLLRLRTEALQMPHSRCVPWPPHGPCRRPQRLTRAAGQGEASCCPKRQYHRCKRYVMLESGYTELLANSTSTAVSDAIRTVCRGALRARQMD